MTHSTFSRILVALGFGWLALFTGVAQAQGTASYYLAIAEDNDVVRLAATAGDSSANLDAYMMAQKYAAWKTQQELLAFRDYPYFQLTNTSEGTSAAITHFRITIDPSRAYNFDTMFYIEASPGITYKINGLDTVQNGLRSDFVDITFTGFTPGKFFRWRSDIDNDTGNINMYTDYRNVLTDAGGLNASKNALVNVDMTGGISFTDRIGANQLMGPYFTSTSFRTEHAMDMVQSYTVGNTFNLPQVIPEPSTWLTLGSMLGAGGFLYRRRRLAR